MIELNIDVIQPSKKNEKMYVQIFYTALSTMMKEKFYA